MNKFASNKVKYIIRSLSRGTHKKFETYVINSIYNKLNNFDIEIVTQQYVQTSNGKKYIDLYFPQLKIAIEVDESYHLNNYQNLLDNQRMENIKMAVLDSTITDSEHEIQFIRIKVYNEFGLLSIEEINQLIEEAVIIINKKIKSIEMNNGKINWIFNNEEKIKNIVERGYLRRGDSFSSMIDILKVFGKEVNGWQRCTYWCDKLQVLIWSPTLSFNGSNKGGWINIISDDLKTIYESGTKGKGKTIEDTQWDIDKNSRRVVFVKYKDALGDKRRRFLGVYKCTGYDEVRAAEIWSLEDINIML